MNQISVCVCVCVCVCVFNQVHCVFSPVIVACQTDMTSVRSQVKDRPSDVEVHLCQIFLRYTSQDLL